MRLTKQYAYALLASIPADSSIDVWFQLQELTQIFKQSDQYVHALDVKAESFQNLRTILNGQFDAMVINFLEVITEEGMLHRLETITEDYYLILVEENILFDVQVYSANPLGEQIKNQIESLIYNRWGENSMIHYQINKNLIGGIRLEVNGAVIDTTFRSRIDQIIREVQHGSKK